MAQEGTRRGRAAAMRVVAAVHALWLCGTEKCPFDFATDGDSANSLYDEDGSTFVLLDR